MILEPSAFLAPCPKPPCVWYHHSQHYYFNMHMTFISPANTIISFWGIQVHLLTPMDNATLLNVKSTISHCQPSLITRQGASVDSRLQTYFNDNAQTPLGRFVVYMLYSQLCNKYSDKSNRWSLGLSLSVASSAVGDKHVVRHRRHCWSQLMECRGEFFPKSTVTHTKMGHVSKTTPRLGVICHPSGKTWYSLPLYKIWSL